MSPSAFRHDRLVQSRGTATILDVLRNAFGARPSVEQVAGLSLEEIDTLSDVVLDFAEAQSLEPVTDGTSYLGGWLASFDRPKEFRAINLNALLYYERLLFHDPLADFFERDVQGALMAPRAIEFKHGITMQTGPETWISGSTWSALRSDPERGAKHLAALIESVFEYEELIDEGIVQMRSQWPVLRREKERLLTSVRHDVRDGRMQSAAADFLDADPDDKPASWDNMRGIRVTMEGGARRGTAAWESQHEFFYLAKSIAIASTVGAVYTPTSRGDLAMLRAKAPPSLRQATYNGQFLAEVASISTPQFSLTPALVVKTRRNESAFEDWRLELRALRREVGELDPEEMSERVEESLLPRVHQIEQGAGKNRALGTAQTAAGTTLINATVAATTQAIAGGNPALGSAGAVVSGVLGWLHAMYTGGRDVSSGAVLATLVKGH